MANARLQHDDPLQFAEDLAAEGKAAEAACFLQSLIDGGRGGLLARLALARALQAAGQTQSALEVARETALLNTHVAVAALGLGEILLKAGQLPTAIGEFQRALRLDPALEEARYGVGCAWLEAGEAEKALTSFGELSAAMTARAQPEIADAQAMSRQQRSDPRYVRHLFDQFSIDYDERMLGQLCYAAPRILRELFALVAGEHRSLRVLDLGSGTGLSGAAFRDLAAELHGIDLSPAMIEKSRARAIYDQLNVGDLQSALSEGDRYDLILAADTLVYLGDLAAVFEGAALSLVPGGFFLFTVEKQDGDDYALGPKRRWRHSQSYLRAEAAQAGFDVAGLMECVPRSEANAPVEGLAVALRKM
ncbi:MAG: methyltransferase domain-containing protein [Proteobacteria bacterium]|nr:methyltransferase domain-containing protein [Pseudomonadota bacterium]